MQTWTFIDKTGWGDGPWQDEATDLVCLAVRGPVGNWCGYVGVAEGHPYFNVAYNRCLDADCPGRRETGWCDHDTPGQTMRVHGGLTYSDFCQEDAPEHGVCHIAAPGQPERVWWLGFDTAHAGDAIPSYAQYGYAAITGGIYRDLSYVQSECANLAAQLVTVASPSPAAAPGETES